MDHKHSISQVDKKTKNKVKQCVFDHKTCLWQCSTGLSFSLTYFVSSCRWSYMHSTYAGYCMFRCISKCVSFICSPAHLYMSPSITADQNCRWVKKGAYTWISTYLTAATSQDYRTDVDIQSQVLHWEKWTGFPWHQHCCVSWATVHAWLTFHSLNQAKGF